MPPEIIALIDKPFLLAAVGAISGFAVSKFDEKLRRAKSRAYWEKKRGGGTRAKPFRAGGSR